MTRKNKLLNAITLSSSAHVLGVVLLIFIARIQIFDRREEQVKDMITAKKIRVDVRAMPNLTLKELRKVFSSQEAGGGAVSLRKPRAEVGGGGKKNFYIEKNRKKKFKDLLAKLGKRKLQNVNSKKKDVVQKGLDDLIVSGNIINKGNQLSGELGEQVSGELTAYGQLMVDKVRLYWRLPANLAELDLRARIRVYIGGFGGIERIDVYESSGNVEFDRKAKDSIVNAGPFPSPTLSIKKKLKEFGLVLGFPI